MGRGREDGDGVVLGEHVLWRVVGGAVRCGLLLMLMLRDWTDIISEGT